MRQREGVRGVIYKGVLAIPIIEYFIDSKYKAEQVALATSNLQLH